MAVFSHTEADCQRGQAPATATALRGRRERLYSKRITAGVPGKRPCVHFQLINKVGSLVLRFQRRWVLRSSPTRLGAYQGDRRPSGRGSINRRSSRTCDHWTSLISGESGVLVSSA